MKNQIFTKKQLSDKINQALNIELDFFVVDNESKKIYVHENENVHEVDFDGYIFLEEDM